MDRGVAAGTGRDWGQEGGVRVSGLGATELCPWVEGSTGLSGK